jgi:hypothetical protein
MNAEQHRALLVGLLNVWSALHGEYWLFWTLHWQSKGANAYGDHLLYQRLYEARTAEIDRVAEIISAVGGSALLQPEQGLQAAHRFVAGIMADPRSNVDRGLYAVQAVRYVLNGANAAAEGTPFALEINNALAGIADKQLEAEYLLKQRADWVSKQTGVMRPLVLRPPVKAESTVSDLTRAYGALEDAWDGFFDNPLRSVRKVKRAIEDTGSVARGVALGTAALGLGVLVYRIVKKNQKARQAKEAGGTTP